MLESTASAVSSTVGLEASYSTTLSLQRINAIYKVKWTTIFKNIFGVNPA